MMEEEQRNDIHRGQRRLSSNKPRIIATATFIIVAAIGGIALLNTNNNNNDSSSHYSVRRRILQGSTSNSNNHRQLNWSSVSHWFMEHFYNPTPPVAPSPPASSSTESATAAEEPAAATSTTGGGGMNWYEQFFAPAAQEDSQQVVTEEAPPPPSEEPVSAAAAADVDSIRPQTKPLWDDDRDVIKSPPAEYTDGEEGVAILDDERFFTSTQVPPELIEDDMTNWLDVDEPIIVSMPTEPAPIVTDPIDDFEVAILCTEDAYECPNGSWVSRNPYDECNFYPCSDDQQVGSEYEDTDAHLMITPHQTL